MSLSKLQLQTVKHLLIELSKISEDARHQATDDTELQERIGDIRERIGLELVYLDMRLSKLSPHLPAAGRAL